jgi:ribulose-phosphate 3-epimerase
MTYICPTVTAFDVPTFQDQLTLVTSFAERIHIDIMDGDFTPTVSPKLTDVIIESDKTIDIHVMYKKPQDIIDQLIVLKPNLVIIHAESTADIPEFAATMREHDIQTGIAVLPETTIEEISYLLTHVQHVLIFGGHLGYHGGSADLSQLRKVSEAKHYSRYLEFGWDGGANKENAHLLKEAGISVINVGGCIHSSENPEATYHELVTLVS